MSSDIDFASLIRDVATHPEIWGEPNKRLSKGKDLRFGKHGARWASLEKGVWHDHESDERGGVLDLIQREIGTDKAGAIEWMKAQGIIQDDAPRQAARARATPAVPQAKPELAAEYEYTDEKGKPLFVVVRFRLPPPELKTFRQRTPDGKWTVKGIRQVPYRLPNVLEAIKRGDPIYIVEGEKDVHNLEDLYGLTATCNAGGAGNWTDEHSKCLRGADVVWLPDNDDAGRSHVANGALSLRRYAKRQRVLYLPELEDKEDFSDWIERAPDTNTRERFLELVDKSARRWMAEPPESKFGAITWEHLDDPGDEHEYIIDQFFTAGDLSVIAGPSKSGKSFVGIHAGMLVACTACDELPEMDFFGRKIIGGGLVIYQAGEGSRGVKKRLRAWRKKFDVPADIKLPFVLLTSRVDLFRDKDVKPLIEEIKAWQAYYDLPLKMVFIDTLATALAGAEENSAKDMSTVLGNCATIRDQCGCHVCLVHHMNAGGDRMRGSTAIYANMDQALFVRKDEGNKVRTVRLDKQKDDEDELSFRFELESVLVGYRKRDGQPMTSCVCVEVGEKDAAARAALRKGFQLADQEQTFFRALLDSLTKHGIAPPDYIDAPLGVGCVVEWEHFRDAFAALLWREEGDDEDRHRERVKRAITRAGKSLVKFGIIGRYQQGAGYVWWTNKPVAGFRKTAIEPPTIEDNEDAGGLLGELGN